MFSICSGVWPRRLPGRWPAIDHHAHAPRLAAPAQPRDHRVLEQAAGLGHRAQVVAEEAKIELGEGCAASARLHVVAQGLHVLVEAGFVLGVELEHPGVLVQLIERILERVFERIAGMREPARLPTFGAQRDQLVEGCDRLPSSSSMDFDGGRNSTHGSSSANDCATSYSACSSATVAGLRPWIVAPGSAMPAWRNASTWRCQPSGCSSLPPSDAASFGQGSFQRISSPPRARPAWRTARAGTGGRLSCSPEQARGRYPPGAGTHT